MCPFGVGCQLSGSQGGGISDSASRGKGDFPFPHEDRRDVTVWRLYVFFACRGFRKPPSPLKRGRRKATQGLGLVGSRPVGWQPAGVPLLRGSGVSESISQTGCLVGQHPAGVFKMSSKCFQKLPWLVFKMSGRCLYPPPNPLKRGRRKAAQRWIEKTHPVGWQPVGVPLLRGSGGSKPYLASIFPSLNQLTLFLNVSRNLVSIPAHVAVIDPHNHQPYSPHLPVSFLVAKTSFRREM